MKKDTMLFCRRLREGALARSGRNYRIIINSNDGLYMVSMDDGRTVDSFPELDLEKAW